MIGSEAVRLVLAEAARYVGEEERPRGSNRSLRIDYWLAEVGVAPAEKIDAAKGCVLEQPGAAWCAAFVHQVGRQALGAAWPVPRTASVHDPKRRWASVAGWAEDKGLLVPAPHVGDLFVVWNGQLDGGRYAHVGLVERLEPSAPAAPATVHTIEGNTNAGGSREGFGVFRRERKPSTGIMYVRWTGALDAD